MTSDYRKFPKIIELLEQAANLLDADEFYKEAEYLTKIIVHLTNLMRKVESPEVVKAQTEELNSIGNPLGYNVTYTNNPQNKNHGLFEIYKAQWLAPQEERANFVDDKFLGNYQEAKEWLIGKRLIG